MTIEQQLTPEQAAEIFQVSPAVILELCQARRLGSMTIAGEIRIDRRCLEEFRQRNTFAVVAPEVTETFSPERNGRAGALARVT